jgi:hypothetical protein
MEFLMFNKGFKQYCKGPEIELLLLPLPGKAVPVRGISFTNRVRCSRSPPSEVIMANSFSWN